MALYYPQVNGMKVSFVSMEFKLAGGFSFTGIKRISYKDKQSIGHVVSPSSGRVIGRTIGSIQSEGDIEIFHDQRLYLLSFLDFIGDKKRGGYSMKSCNFTVIYADTGAGSYADVLHDVRFHSLETNGADGVDPITCTLQMDIFGGIEWSGIPAIRTPDEQDRFISPTIREYDPTLTGGA